MVNPLAYALAGAVGGAGEGLVAQWQAKREDRIRAEQQAYQTQRDEAQMAARQQEAAADREFRTGLAAEDRQFKAEEAQKDRDFKASQAKRSGGGRGGVGTLRTDAEGFLIRVRGDQVSYVTDAEGNRVQGTARDQGGGMKDDLARLRAFESTAQAIFDNAEAQSMEEARQLAQERLGFGIGDLNLAPQRSRGVGAAAGGEGTSSAPDAPTDLPYPREAMDILKGAPTPANKAKFDRHFGAGAADRVLGG